MAYKKIGFKDRIDAKSTIYTIDGEEHEILKENSGVTQEGTSLNAENLNHLEGGILQNSRDIEILNKEVGNIKFPVESVNGKTGIIELKAVDIKTADGTNLENFKKDVTTQYEDVKNQIPKEYVKSVNEKSGNVTLGLEDFRTENSKQTSIYVDGINGKDTNNGAEYSPFETIDRAVMEARRRRLYCNDYEMKIVLKSDIKTLKGRKLHDFIGTLDLNNHTMEEIFVFDSHVTIKQGTVQNTFHGWNSYIKLDRVNVKGEKVEMGQVASFVNCGISLHNLSIDAIEQAPIGLKISNCYIYDSVEITVNNAEVGAKYSESLGVNAKIFKARKCDVEQKKERCYFV